MRMRSFLLATVVVLLLSPETRAAPGDLDSTFGGGEVTTSFGIPAGAVREWDEIFDLALQPDGKIIATGKSNSHFGLARYNPDGSLDGTFDLDGLVTTNFPESGAPLAEAHSLAIQADGKIIVVGSAYIRLGHYQTAIARYNPDGSLDATFSADGWVVADLRPEGSFPTNFGQGASIQPDGKILVLSYGSLIRYNSDGGLDTSFGGGSGYVDRPIPNPGGAKAIALQSDGKIIVAGNGGSTPLRQYDVARFNSDGTLDATFGSLGHVMTSVVADDGSREDYYPTGISLQSDGKILVCGGPGFSMVRYNSNGSLDSSFGSAGIVNDLSSGQASDIQLLSDGKIVLVGSGPGSIHPPTAPMQIARYLSNGSVDGTFGTGGKATVEWGTGRWTSTNAVIMQSDGKIVIGGFEGDGASTGSVVFALARLQGGSTVPPTSPAPSSRKTPPSVPPSPPPPPLLPQVSLSAKNKTADEGVGSVAITITISGTSSSSVSVNYATSNVTATAGADYTSASGTLTWAPGDTGLKTVTIPILEDTIVEPSESFNLTLSSPVNATIGQSIESITITDNDSPASSRSGRRR